MTLTKSDLSAIRQVVKEETAPQFRKLEKGQISLEKRMSNLEKGQSKIARELNKWTKFFDRDYIKLLKRVEKTENRLDITPPEF